MTRPVGLLVVLGVLLACSNLPEAEQGIVALEVSVPGPDTVEVGETVLLSARPLDSNGDSVAAPVVWVSADPTATIDASSGALVGVSPGAARVQATVGTLSSALITFAVVPPADSLVLTTDSVISVTPGVADSPPLTTRLDSFHPPGALANRAVIYTITSPDPATTTPPALLPGGLVADTLRTGADGTAAPILTLTPGAPLPATVIVEVRAVRTRGAVVPGSGQHFLVSYQP